MQTKGKNGTYFALCQWRQGIDTDTLNLFNFKNCYMTTSQHKKIAFVSGATSGFDVPCLCLGKLGYRLVITGRRGKDYNNLLNN